MLPQLAEIGKGFNELEKQEVLQQHLRYFRQQDEKAESKNSKENQIKQLAEEYLKTEFAQNDEDQILKIIESL